MSIKEYYHDAVDAAKKIVSVEGIKDLVENHSKATGGALAFAGAAVSLGVAHNASKNISQQQEHGQGGSWVRRVQQVGGYAAALGAVAAGADVAFNKGGTLQSLIGTVLNVVGKGQSR